MRREKLRTNHIIKQSPYGRILDDISLNLYEGEAVGLLGLHDTGMRALLRILSGRDNADSGSIFLNEEPVTNQRRLQQPDIALIHRHSSLIGSLSIAENIFVIRHHRSGFFFIHSQTYEQQALAQFQQLGIDLDPARLASSLSESERCMVEIAKAYILGASLILIDNSANNFSDTNNIIENLIARMKQQGISFLIADTRWSTLSRYCNRIALLRNAHIWKVVTPDKAGQAVMEHVLLKEIQETPVNTDSPSFSTDIVAKANNLTTSSIASLSFELHAGEVLCLWDYSKAVLIELVDALASPLSGLKQSRSLTMPEQHSVVFTDFQAGNILIGNLSVRDNLCMPIYHRMTLLGVIRRNRMRYIEREFLQYELSRKISLNERCNMLTEAEKLEIYLFRLKLQNPKLLVFLDFDTAIDYSMRHMIHQTLAELAERGTAVLILTTFADDYKRMPVTLSRMRVRAV